MVEWVWNILGAEIQGLNFSGLIFVVKNMGQKIRLDKFLISFFTCNTNFCGQCLRFQPVMQKINLLKTKGLVGVEGFEQPWYFRCLLRYHL